MLTGSPRHVGAESMRAVIRDVARAVADRRLGAFMAAFLGITAGLSGLVFTPAPVAADEIHDKRNAARLE